jgi:hypothetical protein
LPREFISDGKHRWQRSCSLRVSSGGNAMKKPAAVGLLLVLGLAAFVAGRYSGGPNTAQHPSSKRVLYYVDPMHRAYHSDKPGIAADCGMTLEPVCEGDDPAAKLQLAPGAVSLTAEKQQLIGTRMETVAKNPGSRLIRTTGRVEADNNRVDRLMAVTDDRVQSSGDNSAGTEAYEVNLTLKNGQTQHVWVDTKTWLDGAVRSRDGS